MLAAVSGGRHACVHGCPFRRGVITPRCFEAGGWIFAICVLHPCCAAGIRADTQQGGGSTRSRCSGRQESVGGRAGAGAF
jgi:hypothetical protein